MHFVEHFQLRVWIRWWRRWFVCRHHSFRSGALVQLSMGTISVDQISNFTAKNQSLEKTIWTWRRQIFSRNDRLQPSCLKNKYLRWSWQRWQENRSSIKFGFLTASSDCTLFTWAPWWELSIYVCFLKVPITANVTIRKIMDAICRKLKNHRAARVVFPN